MRRLWKLLLFLLVSFLFLIVVSLFRVAMFALPQKRRRWSAQLTVLWARTTLMVLDMKVSVTGTEHITDSGMLIAANHQSYLDIIILASALPALFVAKKDVRSWPLLGWLATLGGTLYIDRSAFRGAMTAMDGIVQALRENVHVAIFPEGTSTNGEQIVRFKPALFRAALTAERSVLPVTINYRSVNGEIADRSNRDLFCWYGTMTFAGHFWALLNVRILKISVTIHSAISFSALIEPDRICEQTYHTVFGGFDSFSTTNPEFVNTPSR